MGKQNFKYQAALNEIETILVEIDNDKIDLDDLTTKLKRVTFLIKECKSHLKKTSVELDELINDWG